MAIRATSWAMKMPIKTPTAKLVLLVLADYSTDTGKSYPRIDTVKAATGLNEDQIENAYQALMDLGIIGDTGKRVGELKETRVFQLNATVEVKKLSPKKKTTRPELLQAEEIYRIYPRRVGKPKSLVAIAKAIKNHGFEFVKEQTRLFATVWIGRPDLNSFCPQSTTWFNQERYNDDPITWGIKASVLNAPLVTRVQVQEKVNQLIGKDEHGWGASFYRYWSNPKLNWKKNGQPIEWEIVLSKQLNIWQSGKQAKESEQ